MQTNRFELSAQGKIYQQSYFTFDIINFRLEHRHSKQGQVVHKEDDSVNQPKKIGRNMGFKLGAVVLGLIFMELAACLFGYWGFTDEERKILEDLRSETESPLLVQNCVPHPFSLYMPKPGYVAHGMQQHNAEGFRSAELSGKKDRCRIFCLGGSTTYSWSEKDIAYTYPSQLETLLHQSGATVEVINAGLPMGTSAEALATLQFRVLPHKPDLVILHIGLNDIHPTLLPGYKADYSHDRNAWTAPRTSLIREHNYLLHSGFARLLFILNLRRVGIRETFEPSYIEPEHWNFAQYWKSSEQIEAKRFVGFRNNIKSLLAICAAHDVEVILSRTSVQGGLVKQFPRFAEAYSQNLEIMKQCADEFAHCHYMDTTNLDIPDEMYVDPCHLTRDGLAVKARAFADFILERGLRGGR